MRRVMTLVSLLVLACITPVTAQVTGSCSLVSAGGYFVIRVNGDSIARHDTELTAGARLLTERLKRPGQTVTATRTQTVTAGGCTVTPATAKTDTLYLQSPPIVRVDTLRPPAIIVRDTLYCSAGVCSPLPPVVTPPADTTTPPPPPPPAPVDTTTALVHPAVWMTPARITKLQVQVANNTERWRLVKNVADAQLARGTLFASGDEDKLPDVCLAYLGTGDVRYAQRAGVVITGYAVEANDLTYDSGYGIRFKLPLVTMGLDWCFNGLTPAQRTQAATWMMNRADWTWPKTNPARAGAWGTTNPKGNYYWGFMMTGPAALASLGLDPRAAGHVALVANEWNTRALPYFTTGGIGGAWDEGTNYESTWRTAQAADAFLTAGRPLADGGFLAATLQWRMQSTMPGGFFKYPLVAQPRDSRAGTFSYDRLHAMFALPFADATLRGQIKTWLDLIGNVPTQEFNETAALAMELALYDPATVSVPLATLPKSYLAPGAGYFVYRSSWTDPAATAFSFESGPSGYSGGNANGIMLWKGAFWVSSGANLYSGSGIETETRNYNNLTVGGVGQYHFDGNGGTIVGTPVVTDSIVAFRGQAKLAYGSQNEWVTNRPVLDYLRSVAYLPQQDAMVFVDRVTVKDSSAAKVWRWHSKTPVVVAGSTFTLTNGVQSCVVTVTGDVTLGTETFSLGSVPGITSYAVTVTAVGRQSDVVVTLLQCGTPVPSAVTVWGSAAQVTIGTRVVTVPLSEEYAITLGGSAPPVVTPPPPPPAPTGPQVVIDTTVRFQSMAGWEAVAQAGQAEPGFAGWKNELMDLAANDLGVNRIRVELASGAENSVDYYTQFRSGAITEAAFNATRYQWVNDNADPAVRNAAGFQFSKMDEAIEATVLPLRARLAARGESLFVTINYVSFAQSTAHANAAEYAEFITAAFEHVRSKYGFAPNALEVILEPDNNTGTWNAAAIGRAIAAVGPRLAAAGFTPHIIAPSVTNMANAVPYVNAIVAVPGASTYLTDLAYHRYSGASDANLVALAARAKQLGLRTAMLEHIGSGIDDLLSDLTLGNASAWQQYTLAYPGTDNGGHYYTIIGGRPVIGVRTAQLREVFRSVRAGATRVASQSSLAGQVSVAFVNRDGSVVSIVRTKSAGPVTITGLPPATYLLGFTTDAGESSTRVVAITGPFTEQIAGAGVLSLRRSGAAP